LANLILTSVPIILILIICYIFFPIPLFYFFLVCLIFLCIGFVFSGIGLLIGVFDITNETVAKLILVALDFIIWSSCVLYPLEMFPEILQTLFRFNPFYYYFDLLRLTWWAGIDYSNAIEYLTIYHILVVVIFTILIPFTAIVSFNKIYNRYGIRGY
ncbi:MAG: ABC transporter permease, partial [Promethearchaeota archaeon]